MLARFKIVSFVVAFVCHAPLLSAIGDTASVRVVVVTSTGEPLGDVYVALVQPEQPWSRPAAEAIGDDAGAAFEVPEGVYRILAGAPGKGIRSTDPITVAAFRRNELRVALPQMVELTGTVLDELGQPLADVTVGDVNAFVEAPLGTVSELAVSQLAAHWITESRADGTWRLHVPEGSANPIVAVADGRACGWWSRKPADRGPAELAVRQSGVLRITVDREAPEFVVTLVSRNEGSMVPSGWQPQLWARRVRTTTLEWASLSPGEYDVFAQQWDPRSFSDAVKVGIASVAAGGSQDLFLELPPSKTLPKSLATVLVPPIGQFDADTIEAFGRERSGVPAPLPHVTEQVSGGTLLYLDTARVEPPYVGTTPDQRFVVLPMGVHGAVGVASVLDLGGASLQVKTAGDSASLPLAGAATFHGCSRPDMITVPFAVAKDGRITFPAPAGCASVVLELDPFSPIVLPRRIPVGDPVWMAEIRLHAAGRAAVRVAGDDGAGVADAIVSVSTQTEEGLQAAVNVAELRTGPDGWVRFHRLPAGRELTVVARTAEGDRSVVEHLRIEPTREAIIDPLRVPRPATVILEPRLDRAFLEHFPDGYVQALFLEPLDGNAEKASQAVDGAEQVEFSRVLPGYWQLGAIVSSGQGMQPVFGEQIELKAGETRRMEVPIKPLVFRGRIAGDGMDLFGNVDILSSRRSDPVPSVPVSSSGEFVAILPRADTYFVGVRPRKTGQMIWAGDVPFLDPSQPVLIELPRGAVVARVRADGRPLADAMVMARMEHQPTTDVPLVAMPVKTGADGEARIEGLLPGQWVVFVLGGGYAQARVTVSSSEVAHVALDVMSGLPVTGTILETFGLPIAGAKVTCLLSGPDGVPYMRLAFTGGDGFFDIGDPVPSRAAVLCSVTSPRGAQGYRVVPGEHARLALPSNPATLLVRSLPEMDRFGGLWLVSRDGRVIEVSPYVARLPGAATLRIPALAPEAWKLVRVSSFAEWMALAAGAGGLSSIVDVTLTNDEHRFVDLED